MSDYTTHTIHLREYRAADLPKSAFNDHVETCLPCARDEAETALWNKKRQDSFAQNEQLQKAATTRLIKAEARLALAREAVSINV